ncbi:MAG TPA: UDP-N-acetylmuramoyl-L-alanine--D-glutamate ligase [Candidatus Nanoarchaeia archaeon]|nr:UDP-N-acetylmuramoyl-L-alanine--D-glutamate ligase [Candidatus Nanoarchaeia archaeon]
MDFKNKKITLMGLGLLGRGVGDAAFFAEAGADLTVTDLKTKGQLESSLESLKKYSNIRFVLGEHRLEDFQNADLVVKAAGVPMDSPFILEAEKNNVPVKMSTEIFAENTSADVVGITGTRGKSTVSYLIYEILKEHHKDSSQTVFLGGNILGVSTISLLKETREKDIAVLELDSWQLQGFGHSHNKKFPENPEGFSPKVSVFTTFMPDHLNYYNGDMQRYFADKANIYRFQNSDNILVVSEQVMGYINRFGPKPKSKIIIARTEDVPDSWNIHIPGDHNRLNIALATATTKALGVPEATIKKAVENFRAAPGRLQLVRQHGGVDIYNDTNSTTQDATIAALKAFGPDKKTILIFGGADKKLETGGLLSMLPEYTKAIVLLPGTGTDSIKESLVSVSKKVPTTFASTMQEAVSVAWGHAQAGDRVIMSPAFASFGLFKNEYDRGDQFNAAVKKL